MSQGTIEVPSAQDIVVAVPIEEIVDDRPSDKEYADIWWMEERTWAHWYEPTAKWKLALTELDSGWDSLMGHRAAR